MRFQQIGGKTKRNDLDTERGRMGSVKGGGKKEKGEGGKQLK